MSDGSPRDAAGRPGPASGRALGIGALLLIVALGLPLTAIALAAGVQTHPTARALGGAQAVPPLPDPPPTSVALPAMEALPLVTAGDRPAARQYRALRPEDAGAAIRMFDAAFARLVAPAASHAAIRAYGKALLFDDLERTEAADQEPFTTAAFEKTAAAAMAGLASDPANADHLNDAAVALFALAQATGPGGRPDAVAGSEFNDAGRLQAAAIRLLADAGAAFPAHRGLAVNLAFFRSLFADVSLGSAEIEPAEDPATAIDGLARYVASNPADQTARLLLASLQARRWDRDGLDEALASLAPIGGDPATEALAHMARGDALVASIDRIGGESPELARARASQALEAYDQALALTQDPAAFAGRAIALDLLGETAAAVDAQRRAVEADPASAVQRLRLAVLEGCAGDQTARRDDAEATLATLREHPDPPMLSDIRFTTPPFSTADDLGADRGTFGISLGSDRLPVTAYRTPSTGGGGYLVGADLFLAHRPCLGADDEPLLDGAVREALDASIALGDPDAVQRQVEAAGVGASGGGDDSEIDTSPLDAARIVAGASVARDARIEATVTAADLLPPGPAAALCRQTLEATPASATEDPDSGISESDRIDLIDCVLRNAGEVHDAATTDWATGQVGAWMLLWSDGSTILEAGDAQRSAGRTEDAERLYLLSAQAKESFAPSMIRLGELALDRRDGAAAHAYYDLALTALEAGGSDQSLERSRNLRRLAQLAHNNRGIAVLMAMAADSAGAPDCAADEDLCRAVAGDFEAAVASDPADWTYLWNLGWIRRLQGDLAGAERSLADAVAIKPDLVQALNDLGVLEARRGATAPALDRLRLAASLDPTYDLAAWNLGVLETSQGPGALADGQAWLREAERRNPDLRSRAIDYITDERIYRVQADAGRPLTIDVTNAPAVGAVAFASIAAIGGLAQLFGAVGEPAQDVAAVALHERLTKTRRRRLADRLRARMPWVGAVGRSSFAWISVLVVLGATTLWHVLGTATVAPVAGFVLASVAVLAAIACHMLGHLLAAGRVRVRPAAWWPGVVLAVVAAPFQLPLGPFPAERVVSTDEGRAWRITLAGPLAVIAAALVAYGFYLVEPLPFLRSLAQIQLAVAAYALMPFAPLDGARLADRHPEVLAGLGLIVAAFSAAFVLGIA